MPYRQLCAFFALVAVSACGQRPQSAAHAVYVGDRQAAERAAVALVSAQAPLKSGADFVAKAAAVDAFELASAQLAQQRGSNADVKAFAAMMVRDHSKSSTDLRRAVAASGGLLSVGTALRPEQQAALAALGKADVAAFDRDFMAAQVKAHQDALMLLQDYAENGDTVSLKAFAGQAAPVVQNHYQQARTIRDTLQ